MGYVNVPNTSEIPRIWGKFHQSKELTDNRQEVKKGMEFWARMKRITIEKSIFFIKLALEDIIKIRFTPGGSVLAFESAKSGITPLIVLPWGARAVEEEVRKELAEKESQGNLTNAEAMQMKKSDQQNPAGNLYALRRMLCTFAALLWTLFGELCPLYNQVFRLWEILDTESVR